MNTAYLENFIAIAEEKNISAAAGACILRRAL